MVVKDNAAYNRREKMLKLGEILLAVEEDRLAERTGCALDELEAYPEGVTEELLPDMPFWYKKEVLEHDYEAERTLRDMGRNREVWFISCQRIL